MVIKRSPNWREELMNTVTTSTKRRKILRKYQIEIIELKNRTIELKNTLEGSNSRLDEAEERISQLEGKTGEFIQSEQQKEKEWEKMRGLLSLRNLWDNIKQTNICNIGVLEGEGIEKGQKSYWKR